MSAVRRTKLLELFWQIHRWVFHVTGGRIGGRMMGLSVMRLTTTGRRSGLLRSTMLFYFPFESNYVVVASNAGESSHPGWYYNLMATPQATVQVGGRIQRVTSREAEGVEREQLWELVTAQYPSYADYQSWTDRKIPVVVLAPQEPDRPAAAGPH